MNLTIEEILGINVAGISVGSEDLYVSVGFNPFG